MPIMGKQYLIRLDEHDLGQLLDGLQVRVESWRNTECYLESGVASAGGFICEECNDSYEARRIAEHYERIIENITIQLVEQRKA